jgi:hypothetical protein
MPLEKDQSEKQSIVIKEKSAQVAVFSAIQNFHCLGSHAESAIKTL